MGALFLLFKYKGIQTNAARGSWISIDNNGRGNHPRITTKRHDANKPRWIIGPTNLTVQNFDLISTVYLPTYLPINNPWGYPNFSHSQRRMSVFLFPSRLLPSSRPSPLVSPFQRFLDGHGFFVLAIDRRIGWFGRTPYPFVPIISSSYFGIGFRYAAIQFANRAIR